jgi:hypothetical protein
MATGAPRKPSASTGTRRPESTTRLKSTLDKMTSHELAGVLCAVLAKHPGLRAEAEQIAIDMIAAPSLEDIANEVHDAVTLLDIESLRGRAGKQAWGYVEPTEAAWELLSESVEALVMDMKRRVGLGLHDAAETICCGIIVGLHRAKGTSCDGPLRWAPDFPAEEACNAITELVSAVSPKYRGVTCRRLVKALRELVPSWGEMIARAADRAARNR